jgi:hypothetical protein
LSNVFSKIELAVLGVHQMKYCQLLEISPAIYCWVVPSKSKIKEHCDGMIGKKINCNPQIRGASADPIVERYLVNRACGIILQEKGQT